MIDPVIYLAISILAVLGIFQGALIAGAPIGRYAWGGYHAVLPLKLRIGSIVAILLYCVFAAFALDKTGRVDIMPNSIVDVGMWIITGYFIVGVIVNALSRSKPERLVMTPTALLLAVAFAIIAFS